MEGRIKDKDDQLSKNLRKFHELDNKQLDLEKELAELEKEKVQSRLSWDQIKRNQLDSIHSLEEMLRNEKEMRMQWSDKYEKETRIISKSNVEMMEIKTKMAEIDVKFKHQ